MPRSRSIVPVVAVLAVGCAHAGAAPGTATGPEAQGADALAQSVIAEVEAVRGLKAKSPIRVQVLSAGPFTAKLQGKELGQLGSIADVQAVWIAFGFAGPGTDAGRTVQEVMDEQVAGFYSPKDKTLYVRTGVDLGNTAGLSQELLLRGILAHEIEHALQDQLFGAFKDMDGKGEDDDAAMAHLALLEGDAMLAMVAVIGKERNVSMAQGLGNFATSVAAMSPEGLVRLSGHSSSLLAAPRLLRDALIFPYIDGMELTGSAFMAGGFPLVNQMFAHPPLTTAQVLHPGVYTEGRQAVPVPQPVMPAAWKRLTDGTLGELGTRAVLEVCSSLPEATAAAAGWRGDHFVVAERPDGRLGLVWQLAVGSPGEATTVARRLLAQRSCWDKVRGDGNGAMGEQVQVLPRGSTVVLVRGAEPAEWGPLEADWSRPLPPAPAPVPPLGAVALQPLQGGPVATQSGHLEGNRYVDPGLALTATVPAGFAPTVGAQGVGLSLTRVGGGGGGFFSFIASKLTPELRQQTFAGFIGGMNSTLGGGKHLEEEGDEAAVTLPLGKGFEKHWKVSDTQFEVRAAILPACGGRAAYLLGSVSSDPDARALLGQWMNSFAVDPKAKASVCDVPAAK
jgi:hypothetical protein